MYTNEDEERKEVIEIDDNDEFDGRPYTRIEYVCPECRARLIPYQMRCQECETLLRW
jgi:hypothetical protein